MKKILFSMLAMLTVASTAFGIGDNAITVSNITLSNSGNPSALLVNINLTEKSSAKGMEFSIDLPAGVVFVTEGEKPVCHTGSMWGVPPTLNLKSSSSLTLTCASSDYIKGSKGLLYAFKIKATSPSSFTDGQTLTGGHIYGVSASINGAPVNLSESNFNITITSCDVVLDENSPFAPESTSGDVSILVKRTIKAGDWSTFCLPFNIDWVTFKSIFGANVQLAEFADYRSEDEFETMSINFIPTDTEDEYGFVGNWPYLIKTSKNLESFEITETIEVEDDVLATWDVGSGNKKKPYGKFIGTYVADIYVPENDMFISDNSFYYSRGTSKIKGFRGYFWFYDKLKDTSAARAFISIGGDDATNIQAAKFSMIENGKVYTVSGQYVGENIDIKRLPKGVYIVDGVKVVNE